MGTIFSVTDEGFYDFMYISQEDTLEDHITAFKLVTGVSSTFCLSTEACFGHAESLFDKMVKKTSENSLPPWYMAMYHARKTHFIIGGLTDSDVILMRMLFE